MDTDIAQVALEGVVRKRRSLSRKLAFVDLETDDDKCVALVADGWALPKSVVAGLRVSVTGVWETYETKGERLVLVEHGVSVVGDNRDENKWENASESAAWRARVRENKGAENDPDSIGADLATAVLGMCLSWADLGRCADPTCLARHRATTRWETSRVKRAEERRAGTALPKSRNETNDRQHEPNETETKEDAHGSLSNKSKHNQVFAKWLVDTFGLSKVRGEHGAGVVDVAGGRGLLSFELALEHDVPATLIEPKKLNLNKKLRKRIKKWSKRFEGEGIKVEGGGFDDRNDSTDAPYEHPTVSNPTSPSEPTGPVRVICATFEGIDCERNETSDEQAKIDTEIHNAVERSSVLIAVHPDQATDAVIETALHLKKPFAVVPCCVFSDLNQHRRNEDGTVVKTYEQMLNYYQVKDKNIKRQRLAFEGRREVLYKL